MLFAHAAAQTTAHRSTAPPPTVRAADGIPTIHLEFATSFLGTIPAALRAATQQPFSAAALVYGLICSKEPETRASQISELARQAGPDIAAELSRLLPRIEELDTSLFLPLADLAVRALRRLSPNQYVNFRANLERLVETDQQIDLFEYMLQRMIVRHLEPHFREMKRAPVQYYALNTLLPEFSMLLSGLARIGHDSEAAARVAFQQGAAILNSHTDLRFLPLTECNLLLIDAAINKTAQASIRLKQQILSALICTAATDGQLRRREAELLRAIADALGMPVPPFLGAGTEAVP